MLYLQSSSSDADTAMAKGYIAGYLHGCKAMLRKTPYRINYEYVANEALNRVKIIWPHLTAFHADLQSIVSDGSDE